MTFWLLDLCCGAGGATEGYTRAGFRVLGVDVEPQPNYPGWDFIQMDALCADFDGFDAVHASPPCQRWSAMSQSRPGLAERYPDLIEPLRKRLTEWNGPWVIENVPGSPLRDPIELCGQMFGLDLYRHRLFESNVPLTAPPHPAHVKPASRAGHWVPGTVMSVAGHVAPVSVAREAMGIDWSTRDELGEMIPPAYTEFIGGLLLSHLRGGGGGGGRSLPG